MKLKDFLTESEESTSSPSELLLALDSHFSAENEDLPQGLRHPGMAQIVFGGRYGADHIYDLMPKQELDHLINVVVKMINNATTSEWYNESHDVFLLHKHRIGQLADFIEGYGSQQTSLTLPDIEDTLYLLKNNASSNNVKGVLGTVLELVSSFPYFEENIEETKHFLTLCDKLLFYFHYYHNFLDRLPELETSFIKASFRQLGLKIT